MRSVQRALLLKSLKFQINLFSVYDDREGEIGTLK